jgi:hypothetical protein
MNVGLLHALYPKARFVHLLRDPLDNCLAIYQRMSEGSPAIHDKRDLAESFLLYLELARHWRETLPPDRYRQFGYEALVQNQETETRELVHFCGLEWDEACLAPEGSDRVIGTASHFQVRKPVYRDAVARWHRYQPWLGDLSIVAATEKGA